MEGRAATGGWRERMKKARHWLPSRLRGKRLTPRRQWGYLALRYGEGQRPERIPDYWRI